MAEQVGPPVLGTAGPWSSREKLEILRCYLRGFLRATTRARERHYVDLFAGPGQNRVTSTGEIIDGSPLIGLNAGPLRFSRLFWVETRPANVASLRGHQATHPERAITVLGGDANQRVDDVLRVLPKLGPTFAFLDPRGTELHWETVRKLALHKPKTERKIELLMLFAYNQAIVRLMPHDPNRMVNEAALDQFMPDPRRWRVLYERRVAGEFTAAEFRRQMLAEYVQGLSGLGYAFVPAPRLIRTPDNHPLYFMVFASDHSAGWEIMTWCLQHVRESQTQLSLLGYEQRY